MLRWPIGSMLVLAAGAVLVVASAEAAPARDRSTAVVMAPRAFVVTDAMPRAQLRASRHARTGAAASPLDDTDPWTSASASQPVAPRTAAPRMAESILDRTDPWTGAPVAVQSKQIALDDSDPWSSP